MICYQILMIITNSPAVPSDPPQSFTGYLSHRQNSANFRWSAVDMRSANGVLTGYRFSCNYTSDGHIVAINKSFDNSTFQFELTLIVDMAEYECVIAASTRAGKGPNSAPVYFTTPGNIEGTHITSNYVFVERLLMHLDHLKSYGFIKPCYNSFRFKQTTASFQCSICSY